MDDYISKPMKVAELDKVLACWDPDRVSSPASVSANRESLEGVAS
jgi:hypothetical protein